MPYGAAQIAAGRAGRSRTPTPPATGRAGASPPGCWRPSAYVYGGEPAKSFVTFSWCLAEFDRDPSRARAAHEHRCCWHFKYMVNALTEVPRGAAGAHLRACSTTWSAATARPGTACTPSTSMRHRVARHIGDARGGRGVSTTAGAPRRATTSPTAPAATRPARRAPGRPGPRRGGGRAGRAGARRPAHLLRAAAGDPDRAAPAVPAHRAARRRPATRTAGRTGCTGQPRRPRRHRRARRVLRADRQRGPRPGDPRAAPGLAGPGALAVRRRWTSPPPAALRPAPADRAGHGRDAAPAGRTASGRRPRWRRPTLADELAAHGARAGRPVRRPQRHRPPEPQVQRHRRPPSRCRPPAAVRDRPARPPGDSPPPGSAPRASAGDAAWRAASTTSAATTRASDEGRRRAELGARASGASAD